MPLVPKLWPDILLLQFAILSAASSMAKPFMNPMQSLRIQGTVTYNERIALPKDALLQLAVVDLTGEDGKQKVIKEKALHTNGKQVPLEFDFQLAEAALIAGHKYAVTARIQIRGRDWFEGSMEISPEIIRKNAVQLHLRRVVYGR